MPWQTFTDSGAGVRVRGIAGNIPVMFVRSFSILLFCAVGLVGFQNGAAQAPGAICPSPAKRCDSTHIFASYQLPFVIKEKLTFGKTYKSVDFYAVVLKSVQSASSKSDCTFVVEEERLALQSEFPDSKVFTSKYNCPEELVAYENVSNSINFLAIYAGATPATAKRMLARVKAKGRYPQAYIKKMRVVLEYST